MRSLPRGNSSLAVVVGQIALIVSIAIIWELIPFTNLVSTRLFPRFSTTLQTMFEFDQSILLELFVTTYRILIAFLVAVVLGILTGFVAGIRGTFGEVANPMANFLLGVPQAIFLPMYILVLGTGDLQKIVFGITGAYFVIVINTSAGVKDVNEQLVLTARSMGTTDWELFRHVYLPGSLPLILTGVRYGFIFATISVLIAEMYVATAGIGVLINRWGRRLLFAELFAAILLVSFVVILLNEIILYWENRVQRWES